MFQEPAVFVKTEIEEGDATQPEMISGRQASRMQVGYTEWGGLSGAMFCYEVESQYRAAAAGCRFWK